LSFSAPKFADRSSSVKREDPTRENRIVLAEIIANYYTCLETIFLRVSQHFENNLAAERRHQDLLEKMTIDIDGVRPRRPVSASLTLRRPRKQRPRQSRSTLM
jgi:hypothetical protein